MSAINPPTIYESFERAILMPNQKIEGLRPALFLLNELGQKEVAKQVAKKIVVDDRIFMCSTNAHTIDGIFAEQKLGPALELLKALPKASYSIDSPLSNIENPTLLKGILEHFKTNPRAKELAELFEKKQALIALTQTVEDMRLLGRVEDLDLRTDGTTKAFEICHAAQKRFNVKSLKMGLVRLQENNDAFKRLYKEVCKKTPQLPTNITSIEEMKRLLRENQRNLAHIKELDLTGYGFSEFPKELFLFENLEVLDLSINRIRKVPKGIYNLKNLVTLKLNMNRLKELPKGIKFLEKLEHLDAADNHIRKLPDELGFLVNLKYLHLGHNKLDKIPRALANLRSLEFLNLSENFLEKITRFPMLKNLEILELSKNRIISIPENIAKLPKLKDLDLSDSDLIILPEAFKDKNLRFMNLSRTIIRKALSMWVLDVAHTVVFEDRES